MKAILLSIQPKWVAKILNGKKTIEVRKKFPKDYEGWVYIYCTKKDKYYTNTLVKLKNGRYYIVKNPNDCLAKIDDIDKAGLTGTVVARFYCDKVTEYINGGQWHNDDTFGKYDDYIKDNILEQSCLTEEELFIYCEDLTFTAINITQLEIFDKPKYLDDFNVEKTTIPDDLCEYCLDFSTPCKKCKSSYPLTKAPQNFCYVEI